MIGRQSGDHRPNGGRYPASVCRRFYDKCHRPTVWRSSVDWRPMVGRPSANIMVLISLKCRPTVSRSSGDHRPTLHRWQNQWKSGDRSTKLLTLVLRQKVVRRLKNQPKSVPTSADNRPTSPDFYKFCSSTVSRPSVLVGEPKMEKSGDVGRLPADIGTNFCRFFLSADDFFVEAAKLKVSLTDSPIFIGFVIGEASGDGRPWSADFLKIFSSWYRPKVARSSGANRPTIARR